MIFWTRQTLKFVCYAITNWYENGEVIHAVIGNIVVSENLQTKAVCKQVFIHEDN